MYHVGEKVVYPMHGAGIIEGIEEKKILGDIKKYYILKVPFGDMKIMVPIENSTFIGMRPIISEENLDDVMKIFSEEENIMSGNWNKRYRDNMEKLKTGDFFSVAEVVRNLGRMEKAKKLSTGEKKMLSNAKQILMSEIVLVKSITQDEAQLLLDAHI